MVSKAACVVVQTISVKKGEILWKGDYTTGQGALLNPPARARRVDLPKPWSSPTVMFAFSRFGPPGLPWHALRTTYHNALAVEHVVEGIAGTHFLRDNSHRNEPCPILHLQDTAKSARLIQTPD